MLLQHAIGAHVRVLTKGDLPQPEASAPVFLVLGPPPFNSAFRFADDVDDDDMGSLQHKNIKVVVTQLRTHTGSDVMR